MEEFWERLDDLARTRTYLTYLLMKFDRYLSPLTRSYQEVEEEVKNEILQPRLGYLFTWKEHRYELYRVRSSIYYIISDKCDKTIYWYFIEFIIQFYPVRLYREALRISNNDILRMILKQHPIQIITYQDEVNGTDKIIGNNEYDNEGNMMIIQDHFKELANMKTETLMVILPFMSIRAKNYAYGIFRSLKRKDLKELMKDQEDVHLYIDKIIETQKS